MPASGSAALASSQAAPPNWEAIETGFGNRVWGRVPIVGSASDLFESVTVDPATGSVSQGPQTVGGRDARALAVGNTLIVTSAADDSTLPPAMQLDVYS